MEVAEQLIPYFKSKMKDERGNLARHVSIQDINFSQIVRGGINNIIVNVKVLSDVGQSMKKIIIREFQTRELLDDEIKRYNELERRCAPLDNVNAQPMINIHQEQLQLVYEESDFDKLGAFNYDLEKKDYIVGKILAMLQGKGTKALDSEFPKQLIQFLLDHLDFSEREIRAIENLLEPHYKIISNSSGGYFPTTLFNPPKMAIAALKDLDEINQVDIDQNRAFIIIIPVDQVEDSVVDRMADVASYFLPRVYREFIKTGDVLDSKYELINFFIGYNYLSRRVNIPSLDELYPEGTTLDFQFLLTFLLSEVSLSKSNPTYSWNPDKLRFCYFLILKKPFLLD
jgi:hypothetical protein